MRLGFILFLFGFAVVRIIAADPAPSVGPGASKDEIIAAYGWPTGQSKLGTREVLNYPQGSVTLENGRVERVDFSAKQPWPAPRPRPAPPAPVSPPKTQVVRPPVRADLWTTDYDAAVAEARRRGVRLLLAFTGEDWSPASKVFREQAATHPDFAAAFGADFVFVRLDFSTRTAPTAAVREQNEKLRARHGVTVYPTLLMLSPEGVVQATIDLTKTPPGDSYRTRVIGAIQVERDRLAIATPPSLTAAQPRPEPAVAEGDGGFFGIAEKFGLHTPEMALRVAIIGGAAVVALLGWIFWRTRSSAVPAGRVHPGTRPPFGPDGVPTLQEISSWSHLRLCSLLAGLAEADSYEVEMQPLDGDCDLVLRRRGDARVEVLVCCVPEAAGAVHGRRVRALHAAMTAAQAPSAWIVAPKGFAGDARKVARECKIQLVDGVMLVEQLRALPPLMLPRVLLREP